MGWGQGSQKIPGYLAKVKIPGSSGSKEGWRRPKGSRDLKDRNQVSRGVIKDAKDSQRSRRSQRAGEVRGYGDSGTQALTGKRLPPVVLGWLPDKNGPVLSNRGDTHSLWGVWDIWGGGRRVRGPLTASRNHPQLSPPLCSPTTRKKMEATSSPAGLVTLMV